MSSENLNTTPAATMPATNLGRGYTFVPPEEYQKIEANRAAHERFINDSSYQLTGPRPRKQRVIYEPPVATPANARKKVTPANPNKRKHNDDESNMSKDLSLGPARKKRARELPWKVPRALFPGLGSTAPAHSNEASRTPPSSNVGNIQEAGPLTTSVSQTQSKNSGVDSDSDTSPLSDLLDDESGSERPSPPSSLSTGSPAPDPQTPRVGSKSPAPDTSKAQRDKHGSKTSPESTTDGLGPPHNDNDPLNVDQAASAANEHADDKIHPLTDENDAPNRPPRVRLPRGSLSKYLNDKGNDAVPATHSAKRKRGIENQAEGEDSISDTSTEPKRPKVAGETSRQTIASSDSINQDVPSPSHATVTTNKQSNGEPQAQTNASQPAAGNASDAVIAAGATTTNTISSNKATGTKRKQNSKQRSERTKDIGDARAQAKRSKIEAKKEKETQTVVKTVTAFWRLMQRERPELMEKLDLSPENIRRTIENPNGTCTSPEKNVSYDPPAKWQAVNASRDNELTAGETNGTAPTDDDASVANPDTTTTTTGDEGSQTGSEDENGPGFSTPPSHPQSPNLSNILAQAVQQVQNSNPPTIETETAHLKRGSFTVYKIGSQNLFSAQITDDMAKKLEKVRQDDRPFILNTKFNTSSS